MFQVSAGPVAISSRGSGFYLLPFPPMTGLKGRQGLGTPNAFCGASREYQLAAGSVWECQGKNLSTWFVSQAPWVALVGHITLKRACQA